MLPVLNQKSSSKTSNNDIKNEIYCPKVTATSKITTPLLYKIMIKIPNSRC